MVVLPVTGFGEAGVGSACPVDEQVVLDAVCYRVRGQMVSCDRKPGADNGPRSRVAVVPGVALARRWYKFKIIERVSELSYLTDKIIAVTVTGVGSTGIVFEACLV